MSNRTYSQSSRRDFIKTTSAVAATAPFVLKSQGQAAEVNQDTLKIGLVGCGGRGNGAASQAMQADENVVLWAVGDVFPEQTDRALRIFKENGKLAPKLSVDRERQFSGLNAFQKVIDSGVDVVLLATPPGFRPQHLAAAIKAGKHVFCEKPMATDAPGVRSVLESSRKAKEKGLSLVSGFCWRYEYGRRAFYERVHDGAIGDVQAIYATYLTGPVKPMPAPDQRPKGMGDVEWQIRNWYNFAWLSGDGLVEQACHSIDKIAWGMQDRPPLRCSANGGRQIPNHEGNIYDHIDVFYEYENGTRAFMGQRQISNCYSDNSDYLLGTKGNGTIKGWNAPVILGENRWRYTGEKNEMYQTEHDELFASIRAGKPMNDGEWMASSTLMAIMGRMAAYTGQEITWEQAMQSKWKLVPDPLTWDMDLPIEPMAMPGQTQFV